MLPYLSNSSIKLETQLGSNANQLFVSVDFLNLPQYVHMTASLRLNFNIQNPLHLNFLL